MVSELRSRASNQRFMNSLFINNMDAEEYQTVVESNQGIESNDTFDVSSDIRYDEARRGYIVRSCIVIKNSYNPADSIADKSTQPLHNLL